MNKDWNYAHMWDTMRRALEESVNSKINDIAKWIATLSENSAQTAVAASGDMWADLILSMDAIVNNTQAEGAEECE